MSVHSVVKLHIEKHHSDTLITKFVKESKFNKIIENKFEYNLKSV